MWKSSDRGKRYIKIKPARHEAPWRLVLLKPNTNVLLPVNPAVHCLNSQRLRPMKYKINYCNREMETASFDIYEDLVVLAGVSGRSWLTAAVVPGNGD